MAIYFCFSDECGSYSNEMTAKQLKAHPFYVRAVIMIDAAEWSLLNQRFKQLKDEYQIPIYREFKWAFLWLMTRRASIHDDENLSFFKHRDDKDRFYSYVEKVMQIANELSFIRIILTYSVNNGEHHKEHNLLKFHFQDILRRIEMEIQAGDNLAVLFIDPVNSEKDEKFRDLYFSLVSEGDFIKYSHVKDSLNIENSHHSVGIQIADFISGIFNSILKLDERNNYTFATKMFCKYIWPNLRVYHGSKYGAGIIEIPSNPKVRAHFKSKIEKVVEDFVTGSGVSDIGF